jgi:hypothetical protein
VTKTSIQRKRLNGTSNLVYFHDVLNESYNHVEIFDILNNCSRIWFISLNFNPRDILEYKKRKKRFKRFLDYNSISHIF